MFKIDPDPTFTRTVTVHVPADGGHRAETLKATFRVLPISQAEAHDFSDPASYRSFFEKVIVRLEDIVGDDGEPVPYSDRLRDQLLDLPYVRRALGVAYFEALAEAKRGN